MSCIMCSVLGVFNSMDDLNKWAAEQCGVSFFSAKETNEHGYYWFTVEDRDYEWTITDHRCREIVIQSILNDNVLDAYCVDMLDNRVRVRINTGLAQYQGFGKTIAEAEIACITAIYEARE